MTSGVRSLRNESPESCQLRFSAGRGCIWATDVMEDRDAAALSESFFTVGLRAMEAIPAVPQRPPHHLFRSQNDPLAFAAAQLFEERAHVARQRSLQTNERARHRVREADLRGVQRLPLEAAARPARGQRSRPFECRRADRRAPDDPSQPDARESDGSDPSRARGEGATSVAERFEHGVARPRSARRATADRHSLALVWMAADRPLERSRWSTRHAEHDRQVEFLRRAGRETRAPMLPAHASCARRAECRRSPCRAGERFRAAPRRASRETSRRCKSAFTTVPRHAPGAGCTTIPAGLSTASTSSSS